MPPSIQIIDNNASLSQENFNGLILQNEATMR